MATDGPTAMNIEFHQLMSWFSPAFPIGAFSYSHGLEAAIANGDVIDGTTLNAWLLHLLENGSGWNDCLLIAAAYRAETSTALEELCDLSDALAAGRERQVEARQQGDAFAKTLSAVSQVKINGGPLPIVVGNSAQRHGIALESILAAYLHAFVSNLISAATRMIALGQVEAQKILASMFPLIDKVTKSAQSASLDDLAAAAFWLTWPPCNMKQFNQGYSKHERTFAHWDRWTSRCRQNHFN